MAQTANADIKAKGYGLAAYLALESLIDHLMVSRAMTSAEIKMILAGAIVKCRVHEGQASPHPAVGAEAHIILDNLKDGTPGP